METIAEPGSTKPLIQLFRREDGFTKLLGHRDCLSLCHYTGAKAIISVEPGHRFLSEGIAHWENLISPGRNIIYPIHKQISRLVINMRKAYMKQMAERWRAGTSSDHQTAEQGHVDWCLQPHALPPPSKVNQEKAASLRKVQEPQLCGTFAGVRATLSVRLSVEQEDQKGVKTHGPVV